MSNEELALKVQAGDISASEVLWDQVRPMCYMFVKRFMSIAIFNRAVDMDDLMQCAYISLIRAAKVFNPDKGAFGTILEYYVRQECQALLGLRGRKREEHYVSISLDSPIATEEDMELTVYDLVEDDSLPGMADGLEENDFHREVWEAVGALPSEQAIVIRECYLQGNSLEEVAKRHGFTRAMAKSIKNKAFKILRNNLSSQARLLDYDHWC